MFSVLNSLTVLLQSLWCWTLPQQYLRGPVDAQKEDFTLRPMVGDDLDDVTTVVIDAFKPSAAWNYTHLNDRDYTEYTWHCTRREIEAQWRRFENDTAFVNVITVPTKEEQDGEKRQRVVSIAAWRWILPTSSGDALYPFMPWPKRSRDETRCSQHLDSNITRTLDAQRQLDLGMERYIYSSDKPQLYLNVLATHPDWDGHGFAASQLRVGVEKAKVKNDPVTLFATPAGYPLYTGLGFTSMANLTITKLDRLGSLWFEYMQFDTSRTYPPGAATMYDQQVLLDNAT
ncbi:Hypothetical protein D9617_21g097550 [Elsinoe fawcettii]|nr:Hypothetical protein D9617_21g097550 [Elsinoe fawcettii]